MVIAEILIKILFFRLMIAISC